MALHWYAIRPKTYPAGMRIEKADNPMRAARLAFGRGTGAGWEYCDLGTRVTVVRSDKQRRALTDKPENWHPVTARR